MTIQKITLATQLHVGRNLDLSKIIEVKNPIGDRAKPNGGFWTSTYIDEKVGSEFFDKFISDNDWYILEPLEADIFVVENISDVEYLLEFYGRPNTEGNETFIDFEKLSKKFDALQLKSSCFATDSSVKILDLYNQKLNIHNSNRHPFHQWWAESTLWFCNKFKSVIKIQRAIKK
ncbi:hypothetical protein [Bacillus cereus]|uniref:hypothetical protein n=1 Tax=Bacillus cereus group TaxID=86661 RepID=UPI0018A7B614|nr:hypothetical protein [Bacillus cereus]MBF8118202.1 hypothetical protein [Bacillus cereus]MCC3686977.1 hypothetical protein [Bacillus cereus]